jgi:hypothetical protein
MRARSISISIQVLVLNDPPAPSTTLLPGQEPRRVGRGLHSFTSQLNLSALYEIEGARRGCVACVMGVLGGVYGI